MTFGGGSRCHRRIEIGPGTGLVIGGSGRPMSYQSNVSAAAAKQQRLNGSLTQRRHHAIIERLGEPKPGSTTRPKRGSALCSMTCAANLNRRALPTRRRRREHVLLWVEGVPGGPSRQTLSDEVNKIVPAGPISRSAAAERMRAHRQRRQAGLRCVTIELRNFRKAADRLS